MPMTYKFPESDKGFTPSPKYPQNTNLGRFWEVDKGKIYSALAQIEKEEKLTDEQLRKKIHAEIQKEIHGTPAERQKWAEKFNWYRYYPASKDHAAMMHVTKAMGASYRSQPDYYNIYYGPLRDYWYAVLGYGKQPFPRAACQPERVIEFL